MSGALVLKHANKENNQEHVNVIHQLHSTVERNAMARQRKIKYATKMYPVQVRLVLQSLRGVIFKIYIFFFFFDMFEFNFAWFVMHLE